MNGLPAQLALELGGIDGIAKIVPRTVRRPIEIILVTPKRTQDRAQHGQVVALAVRTHQIRLAYSPACHDRPHGGAVIVHMNPITHIAAVTIQLRTDAVDNTGNLPWNKLLDML